MKNLIPLCKLFRMLFISSNSIWSVICTAFSSSYVVCFGGILKTGTSYLTSTLNLTFVFSVINDLSNWVISTLQLVKGIIICCLSLKNGKWFIDCCCICKYWWYSSLSTCVITLVAKTSEIIYVFQLLLSTHAIFFFNKIKNFIYIIN